MELGRIDIITKVSELSSFLAMPREGHLDAVFHKLNYLEKQHNARVVFDPSYPTIDMTSFKECDWSSFMVMHVKQYHRTPQNPVGRMSTYVRMFVDSDHAGDKRTQRS